MAKPARKTAAKPKAKPKATRGPNALAMPQSERDYQVRDAFSTVKRAEEIRRDPAMMAKVRELAKQEKATIDKLARGGNGKS